ncbi:pilus assembly protein CpaB [Anaerobacterium chartisolvens]|uniref:Pilus assembly protein CpaB n=1 Tax=Anaerobacterium chartisolvens TaxID=1297424 RepID=A0A369AMK8_9FIRM|nr:Flp pilus assembly protein CpaB [Anaerobacterium chartisolvens]RCX10411.1 pilus assembly protein CpaB [Anaerobacterium chartisolvens]
MRFLRNKIVIFVLCSALALLLAFVAIPAQVGKTRETEKIIRVSDNIPANTLITAKMLKEAEVGRYNLPKDIIRDSDSIVGKYSAIALTPSDNLVPEKFMDKKEMEDEFLYSVDDRGAVSVTVKSLAAGLSGKLLPGDVVSVLVYSKEDEALQPGYTTAKGVVKEYANLEFVEVGAVTNNKAEDTDVVKSKQDKSSSDTIIPNTVTLLVTKQQAKDLIDAENSGVIHILFRGRGEAAKKLLGQNGGKDVKNTTHEAKAETVPEQMPDVGTQAQNEKKGTQQPQQAFHPQQPQQAAPPSTGQQGQGKKNTDFNLR